MGRYLDLAKKVVTAPNGPLEPECVYEINELYEKSPDTANQQDWPRPTGIVRRAVLLQAPDGVPDSWVQGTADLQVAPPHPAWTDKGWKTLQDDALRFLQQWAGQARRLGWDALDLFGVLPTAPVARMDGKGLVLLLGGRPVAALAEDSAAIRATSGGTLTYRRHPCPPAGRCLVWDLPA